MRDTDPHPDEPTEAGWLIYNCEYVDAFEVKASWATVEVRSVEAKSSILLTVFEAQQLRDLLQHAIDFASIPVDEDDLARRP